MKKLFVFAGALALAGCATNGVGTVRLDSAKALLTAEVSFKTLQQVALAGIQSGVIKGATKAKVIALVDQGQAYETQAYQAEQQGGAAATAIASLTDIVAQLNALGIKG